MLCLSDNDLVLKLAEFDVLDEALHVLGVSRKDVLVLPTALAFISKSPKLHKTHTRSAIQRATEFCQKVDRITRVDREEQILLSSVPWIDQGEAILFAATKGLTDFRVATGDKKSLRALAHCSACAEVRTRLKGRVVCLEKVVRMLIDAYGYAWTQKRVGPTCHCDDCVLQAFANGKSDHPQPECVKWLDHFVAELRLETGDLLVA